MSRAAGELSSRTATTLGRTRTGASWAELLSLRADVTGELVERREEDGSTTFYGEPKMWMAAFARPARRVVGWPAVTDDAARTASR